MKWPKVAIAFALFLVLSSAMLAQGLLTGSTTIQSSGTIGIPSLSRLHTEGRYVKDESGNVVLLRGACTPQGGDKEDFWAGSHQLEEADFAIMKSWNANVVRFTFNGPSFNDYSPSIDTWVNRAEANSLYIILDMHRWDGNIGDCPPNVNDWITMWTNLANRYKARSHVLFELFNEPATWTFSQWRSNAQQAVNAIRGTGASNIILVDGWNWANELNSFTQNGYLNGSNLIYTVHLYKNCYGQTPPADHDGLQSYWRNRGWFYPIENNIAPVLYGEFNIQNSWSGDPNYPDEATARDERNWMNMSIQLAEEWGISYTAWGWVGYESWAWDHEYLLLGDWITPAPSGQILQTHLKS